MPARSADSAISIGESAQLALSAANRCSQINPPADFSRLDRVIENFLETRLTAFHGARHFFSIREQ